MGRCHEVASTFIFITHSEHSLRVSLICLNGTIKEIRIRDSRLNYTFNQYFKSIGKKDSEPKEHIRNI